MNPKPKNNTRTREYKSNVELSIKLPFKLDQFFLYKFNKWMKYTKVLFIFRTENFCFSRQTKERVVQERETDVIKQLYAAFKNLSLSRALLLQPDTFPNVRDFSSKWNPLKEKQRIYSNYLLSLIFFCLKVTYIGYCM